MDKGGFRSGVVSQLVVIGWLGFIGMIFSGCYTDKLPKRAESLSEINRVPRVVARHAWVDAQPWGRFLNQKPTRILLMDSGNDPLSGGGSISYLKSWGAMINRQAYQDIPVHFIVDPVGVTWSGRNVITQAEVYEFDRFSRNPRPTDSISVSSDLNSKMSWGNRISLNGYIVVLVVGDMDASMPNDRQEPVMVQLLHYLCNEFEISPKNIDTLYDIAPGCGNPGQYLRNYVDSGTLTKLINEPKPRNRKSLSIF